MPIYEYACLRCSAKFSNMTVLPESKGRRYRCPKCGSNETERIVESPYVAAKRRSEPHSIR